MSKRLSATVLAGAIAILWTVHTADTACRAFAADASDSPPDRIGTLKQEPAGSFYTTQSPKLVTFPDQNDEAGYFYIQEDDRSSGIKVIPGPDQPVARLGERAFVSGFLEVECGEAVIYASSVFVEPSEDHIRPIATVVRNIGGSPFGVQPATLSGGNGDWGYPQCLNTTGLLVRVSGKLIGDGAFQYIDDGSPFPLQIEFFPGTECCDGDYVSVTGVSSVVWDGARGYRVIKPRNACDIAKY